MLPSTEREREPGDTETTTRATPTLAKQPPTATPRRSLTFFPAQPDKALSLSLSLTRKRGVHWSLAHWAASWHPAPLVAKSTPPSPLEVGQEACKAFNLARRCPRRCGKHRSCDRHVPATHNVPAQQPAVRASELPPPRAGLLTPR